MFRITLGFHRRCISGLGIHCGSGLKWCECGAREIDNDRAIFVTQFAVAVKALADCLGNMDRRRIYRLFRFGHTRNRNLIEQFGI